MLHSSVLILLTFLTISGPSALVKLVESWIYGLFRTYFVVKICIFDTCLLYYRETLGVNNVLKCFVFVISM